MNIALDDGALVAVIVIGTIQLGLIVWAFVDLFRRPTTSGLPRWAWILVILLLNILGPILYFAIGRTRLATVDDGRVPRHTAPPSATHSQEATASTASTSGDSGATVPDETSRARRAVDSVYGPADRAGD